MLKEIKDDYVPNQSKLYLDNENYDYSYCENEDDLAIWKKNSKSDNLAVQELHALFLGLCQKVKNRDLNTDKAQLIFEDRRNRLLK